MYHVKGQSGLGYHELAGQDNPAGLKWIRLGVLRLAAGEAWTHREDAYETVLVLQRGTVEVEVGGQKFGPYTRSDVFAQRATAVYVPIQADVTVRNAGEDTLEVAVCFAKAEDAHEPFAVTPDEVLVKTVGIKNYQRQVHDIVVNNAEGRVHRIIVGETFNPEGNWSSYPPHKHDDYQPGVEALMEEIYLYRIQPDNGFGFQAIYTSDGAIDEVFRVKHGDVFLIPRGYHPVCAAGGYQLYYLWLMAGPVDRVMIPHDDPEHAWIPKQ